MSSEVAGLAELFNCINYAIGSSFTDVMKRLKIKFKPPCINDLDFCRENHKKNGVCKNFSSFFYFLDLL